MSASREKKNREDLTGTARHDPKTAHAAQEQKAMKRSNFLYGTIAVVFVVVAAASIVWRTNLIPKNATAATVNGEKYSVNEVTFYYQNTQRDFMNRYGQFLGYLGVNVNAPLGSQVMSEDVASMLGAEPNTTFKDYLMDQALNQIASVQDVLKTAEEENFAYPDSVQAEYDQAMDSLRSAAASSNLSVSKYLQNMLGRSMTEKVYGEQLMDMLKYEAYLNHYEESLVYSDEEIEKTYQASPNTYDKADFETVRFSGVPAPKTDDEGNPIEATEEETKAAMDGAKAAAEEMLSAYQSGKNLETLSKDNEAASYSNNEAADYSAGDPVSEWVFAEGRKDGDTKIIESGSSYVLAVFHNRFRQEDNTIDVRHILIRPEAGTLAEGDEGYEAEQTKLKADARAKADEILTQWSSGEATEDSFAQLARENSADGNAAQGGIYHQVVRGQMVPSFNDWCFDASRKAGDTGVVDTDFGSHVMYFVGTNLPQWKADVVADLKEKDFSPWYEAFGKDAAKETNDFGMRFIG